MTAATSHEIGASRLITAFPASDLATGPPADTAADHARARSGGRRPTHGHEAEDALVRGGRVVVDIIRKVHDGMVRRRAVSELRQLGRARLADLGIEPDRIEHAVDAMIAAGGNRSAMRGG